MKEERSLSELFEKAKRDAKKVPVSEVKSLVESGRTSPLAAKSSYGPRRIARLFNPLKILIMITPIIIITAALLTWNAENRMDAYLRPAERQKTEDRRDAYLRPAESKRTPDILKPVASEPKSMGVPVLNVPQTAKPAAKDTMLKGIILDLSKEELTRVGFMFDEEGYYYLNKLPDGSKMNFWSYYSKSTSTPLGSNGLVRLQLEGGSFGFASGGFVNKTNKSPLHDFDFYPVLTTNTSGEDLYPIDQIRNQVKTSFEFMNDTLVPILFSHSKLGGYDTKDMLIWFKVSENFFDILHTVQSEQSRSIYHLSRELSTRYGPKDRVSYAGPTVPMQKILKLKPEVFECMGFQLSSDTVDYLFNSNNMWITLALFGNGNRMKIDRSVDSSLANRERVKLYFIAQFDKNGGSQPIGNAFGNQDTYEKDLEFCVPVQLDNPALPPFVRDAIFWIYPTDHFFECLPPEIAGPMREEFNSHQIVTDILFDVMDFFTEEMPKKSAAAINKNSPAKGSVQKDTDPVPCVYFTNLCESLPGLDYVNLYPNPATDKLNVDMVLQKAKNIRFRVFDLGGRVISDEGKPQIYSEGGQFKHTLDISKLQSGFYLLILTDDEGAKLTRRFVKN